MCLESINEHEINKWTAGELTYIWFWFRWSREDHAVSLRQGTQKEDGFMLSLGFLLYLPADLGETEYFDPSTLFHGHLPHGILAKFWNIEW